MVVNLPQKILFKGKQMKYKMILVQVDNKKKVFTSVKDVSEFLGVSPASVYNYIKKGSSWCKVTPFYFEKGLNVFNKIMAWYK